MTTSLAYSRAIRGVAPLPAGEQHALACRFAERRDPRDAQRLVLANLRLVISIAASLGRPAAPDWMDLVQEGNAGLMVAIDRFDPARGVKLSAYASIWIRAFILRHLMEMTHAVRPSTREGRRRFFERSMLSDVPLDAPSVRGGDRPGAPALDFVTGDESLRPDVAAEARDEVARLRAAVAQLEDGLDERRRVILRSRLLCAEPKPLRQVGTKLALSGERVRQLEREMLDQLRALVAPASQEARSAA